MVPFNKPPYIGKELEYVREAVEVNHTISGDGPFTKRCNEWMEQRFGRFNGADEWTTRESDRLTRLPMHYGMTPEDVAEVVAAVQSFFDA